jgi:predicted secreted Zn-dependent protease
VGSADEALPLDTSGQADVVESVGPVAESSYAVEASSLADVVAAIGGRSEAGHVGWGPTLDFHQTDGRIDAVTISVSIDLQMPSWSPPSSMLPRARAEWTRWYAALRAHEQGHIDLVHTVFDGLAARLLGATVRTGQQRFENAKASLSAQSRAYDTRTGNGTRTGTVMNVSIEQQELDEERRKRDAETAKKREAPVPKVGDEEE